MDLDDIKESDPVLVAAFAKFTTRVRASEYFHFWFDNGNNEGKYKKYIKPGAPKELALHNSALVNEFKAKASTGAYSEMGLLFVRAREEVRGMLAGHVAEFEKSGEYKDYLVVKNADKITKTLKLLGLTGSKAEVMEGLVKGYVVATVTEKRDVLKKMEKIAEAEKIAAALRSAGLV